MIGRAIFAFFILFVVLTLAPRAFCFDESTFWLSKKDKHLMPLLMKAADLAMQSGDCKDIIDGSKSKSKSTPSNPVFFVTCEPKSGFPVNLFYSKSDIEKAAPKGLAKPIGKKKAQSLCMAAAKEQARHPSSVDFHALSLSTRVANNGNTSVVVNFDAKNEFGAMLPYRAKCLVTPNGKTEVNITRR